MMILHSGLLFWATL